MDADMLLEMFEDMSDGIDFFSGTYSFSGSSENISGLWDYSSAENVTNETGEVISERAYAYLKQSELSHIRTGGTIEKDSEIWRVEIVQPFKSVLFKVELAKEGVSGVYSQEIYNRY